MLIAPSFTGGRDGSCSYACTEEKYINLYETNYGSSDTIAVAGS